MDVHDSAWSAVDRNMSCNPCRHRIGQFLDERRGAKEGQNVIVRSIWYDCISIKLLTKLCHAFAGGDKRK